jgi:putative ABC transport system permease protein
MLRRSPAFTAVAVLALALGIGANTAVFTVVNGVLMRPMPFPEPEKLFLVSYSSQPGPFDSGPALVDRHYLEFRQQDRLFEHIATFTGNSASLTGAGDPVQLPAANVTSEFFSVLRVKPAIGRGFLAGEDQPGRDKVVILGDKLWRARFNADPGISGKTIKLDGLSYTVIGVMPAGLAFPNDAELWMPLVIAVDDHNSFLRPVVGRLKPGVSRQQAQAELDAIAPRFSKGPGDQQPALALRLVPLKDLLVARIRESLLIFAGAVAFVLLIACANVANLLLARAAGRYQEMGVRTALGASRGRLIRQLLTESTLVSLAGGAAGIVLALWGVPALLAIAPAGKIPRIEQVRIDGWVLAFTIAVSFATGIIFGLAPALQVTRRHVRESLSHGGRTIAGMHERLRGGLVVAEMALALILLTGAGLMLKSFVRLSAVDPGFRPENVLTMTVDLPTSIYRTAQQMQAFHAQTLAKLSGLAGVRAAGVVNFSPLGSFWITGDFKLEDGRQLPAGYAVAKPCTSPGYFRAMGIRLLSGRDFTEQDNAKAPGVVVISQAVARRLWPAEDPIGKRISMQDNPKPADWLTIVGVVGNVRQESLTEGPRPAIYQPYTQITHPFFLGHMNFVVRTASDPYQLSSAMRGVVREVDRDQPVMAVQTMQDVILSHTAEPRFQARLLGVFSILALLLASLGIYGVLAYSVAQRTHEIGIRMALGAQRGDVLRIVLRRTILLAATGIAVGAAGAFAVTRVLSKVLFEVKPTDPATFALVALLLAAVALAAGLIPARRATKVDPMVALRYE